jgi:hypothetical protein
MGTCVSVPYWPLMRPTTSCTMLQAGGEEGEGGKLVQTVGGRRAIGAAARPSTPTTQLQRP